ncbi:MAG: glycosyltransferase family 2 protein [Bacteroidia bacterium]|nr:glycosyltransferase family 2 protein [Bacteroidia bacterium]MCO5253988.1 glycosyltransferase family 2 protein [Bacteroidota bacterium]MCZ2128651.1 glycosyltransferase family 2 protein [Bacteroidia bacterium]
MEKNPKVAVVILNYSTRNWLEKFLPSVLKTNWSNLEIVVADNASTDDSVEFVKTHFSQITLLQFHKNFGFTGGYNKALSLIQADYYVLLNSDIEVDENWLQPLVQLAKSDNSIAAVQPLIIDWKDKSKYEYAGAAGGFIDKYGYPFCRGRIFDSVEKIREDYNQNREVFWASGASLFIRASKFHEVGGLDNNFFAHMEEIDLCWRLKNKGYKIMLCAESRVYHVGGATLAMGHPRKTFLNFHNGLAMMAKNLPRQELFSKILIRLLLDHLAAYRFLFSGKIRHFGAVAKAHFRFLTRIRYWTKQNLNHYQLTERQGIYNRSIVLDYYLRGKKKFEDLVNF